MAPRNCERGNYELISPPRFLSLSSHLPDNNKAPNYHFSNLNLCAFILIINNPDHSIAYFTRRKELARKQGVMTSWKFPRRALADDYASGEIPWRHDVCFSRDLRAWKVRVTETLRSYSLAGTFSMHPPQQEFKPFSPGYGCFPSYLCNRRVWNIYELKMSMTSLYRLSGIGSWNETNHQTFDQKTKITNVRTTIEWRRKFCSTNVAVKVHMTSEPKKMRRYSLKFAFRICEEKWKRSLKNVEFV